MMLMSRWEDTDTDTDAAADADAYIYADSDADAAYADDAADADSVVHADADADYCADDANDADAEDAVDADADIVTPGSSTRSLSLQSVPSFRRSFLDALASLRSILRPTEWPSFSDCKDNLRIHQWKWDRIFPISWTSVLVLSVPSVM